MSRIVADSPSGAACLNLADVRRWVVGIDVGGTFTDLCAWDGEQLRRAKVPTTPGDFTRGIRAGLAELQAAAGFQIVAGSTVATNALLERRGERVAFVGSEGFADMLAIGRQNRPQLYDLFVRKPEPLVGLDDCLGLAERIGADGGVLRPLDDAASAAVLDEIERRGIRSVAVCLLFSYLNPAHEERFAALARDCGINVCCSSELLPEFREFERASTTVVNAYVGRRTSSYLTNLEAAAREAGAGDVRIMLSSGGQGSPEDAGREAVRTILSGPAGGAIAAAHAAKQIGLTQVLTYDMGGTSTDVALCDGEVGLTRDTVIDGWPIRVPQLAIHTVGHGGGSIASVDGGGALSVGPGSAGADPGPACYGRGTTATVTDANVVLGRIVGERFLGGRMRLDSDRANAAVGAIAGRLSCTSAEAARAIVDVANAGMEHALQVVSSRRGVDPADFWLVSFGGAGGLHACALAEAMKLRGVIVPPDPGILSATGMILADVVKDFSQSLLIRSGHGVDLAELRSVFGRLMDRAAAAIFRDGFDLDDCECIRSVDVRYVGQSHELTVRVESLTDIDRLAAPFHRMHEIAFGMCDAASAIEVVTARVRIIVETPKFEPRPLERSESGTEPTASRHVEVTFDEAMETAVYERTSLRAGHCIRGPALVVEDHATTLVLPRWRVDVEAAGHLRMTGE